MKKDIIRVLFIGNSHTFYNDMPYVLSVFSEKTQNCPKIEATMIAHGGKSLGEHKTEPEVRFNILYGNYHYIVLQQVTHPFTGGEKCLIDDGKEINEFITCTNATPIAYMTWAEKDEPNNQKALIDGYTKLSREIHGKLCPVGEIWQLFIKKYHEIELYDSDREHANKNGSYLIACTFYYEILKLSPIGLPSTIYYKDNIVLDIRNDIASKIQQTVDEYFHQKVAPKKRRTI